jgi:prolipoprotein diacylglyceryl transferase
VITWDVDPVLFSLGPLNPRWYGILFAGAFLASYAVMRRVFLREGHPQRDLDQLTITMIVSTIIGARLGHVLFYEPQILWHDPMDVIAVWKGGLASHGGALGIIIGLWWFARKHPRYSLMWLLDRIVIVAALSGAFIRIGNLFNSEIIGRTTDVSWAFVFTRVDMLPRHPTQIYEALLCIALFVLLWYSYKRTGAATPSGRLFGIFCILLFSGRFLIEFLKEHQEAFEASLPLDMGQLLSIPFVLVGIIALVRSARTASPAR